MIKGPEQSTNYVPNHQIIHNVWSCKYNTFKLGWDEIFNMRLEWADIIY